MRTVVDALDNAMCESLIGTMKIERLNRQPWRSIEDVRAAVFEWIESWYNRRLEPAPARSSDPQAQSPGDGGRQTDGLRADRKSAGGGHTCRRPMHP
jgi:Integrase core domain